MVSNLQNTVGKIADPLADRLLIGSRFGLLKSLGASPTGMPSVSQNSPGGKPSVSQNSVGGNIRSRTNVKNFLIPFFSPNNQPYHSENIIVE